MSNFAGMLKVLPQSYRPLLLQVVMLVTLYFLSRIAFIAFNPATARGSYWELLLASLRFDLCAVIILNSPVIAAQLIPARFVLAPKFRISLSAWVIPVNAAALLLNCIDAAWFPYVQKRTTADFFSLISTGDDFNNNILLYVADYFHLLLFWMVLVAGLIIAEKKIRSISRQQYLQKSPSLKVQARLITFVAAGALFVLGFRGGISLKPLSVQSAASMVSPEAIPLVLNTPFTLIKSWGDARLVDPAWMSVEEARKIFDIRQRIIPSGPVRQLNVVVLILESFSYDYISFYGKSKNTTPFLDSLMRSSACWPNTFANGKRSIDGIPAVTASLPGLMDQAFISSQYNTSSINSIASMLKTSGYRSGFFHGGNNGTMGFDNLSHLSGYEGYYGRDEFKGNPEDYDGHWGIYDHAYLKFMLNEIERWEPPFTATFFSLSSHHPWQIPLAYEKKVPQFDSPVMRSMAYTDLALREFFTAASKTEWFDSTIFVITSDHTGPAASAYTSGRLGAYHIPLMLYAPAIIRPEIHLTTAQQTDILPTVMGLLNHPGEFTAFGHNLYGAERGWSVSYANQSWQLITDDYILHFDGNQTSGYYSRSDSLLKQNLLNIKPADMMQDESLLKAVIKQYHHGLIHNRLVKP